MSEIPPEELISAYFDGELTDDERKRAETLLTESEDARRQLDDLRALSHTLKAMPQESLGEDLSGKVLRQAERAMLTEGRDGGSAAATSNDIHEPLVRRLGSNWRSLAWPVAAIAAALLVSFV
ncbi:unnamed protein product, partial [marine sediment metagenome]